LRERSTASRRLVSPVSSLSVNPLIRIQRQKKKARGVPTPGFFFAVLFGQSDIFLSLSLLCSKLIVS
jgi:hypothetical protein